MEAKQIRCEWCPAEAYSMGKIAPGFFMGCTSSRSCPTMAGYLDAQMRQRLTYLCKELVKPPTTQDKIVSLTLVATQKAVAPQQRSCLSQSRDESSPLDHYVVVTEHLLQNLPNVLEDHVAWGFFFARWTNKSPIVRYKNLPTH